MMSRSEDAPRYSKQQSDRDMFHRRVRLIWLIIVRCTRACCPGQPDYEMQDFALGGVALFGSFLCPCR